jgi:stigma-specific protein Stig1
MGEHRLDRLAKRLVASEEAVSRRRFLVGSAVLAAASAVPLRVPAGAAAATVTSCSCQGYGDSVYLDCWNEYVDGAGPFNDENGALAALQFGIANEGGRYRCLPKGDQAQANCQQVPCPAGQNCVTPPFGQPVCQDSCGNGCASGETCCDGTCVSAQTDSANCGKCGHVCIGGSVCENGHCGQAKCSPTCTGGQLCCKAPGVLGFLCTNPKTDNSNCGACGNACQGTTYCCNGACVDLSSDPNNCGNCGMSCGGQDCCNAMCVSCASSGGMCCSGPEGPGCYAPACCGCVAPAECCNVNGVPTCCPNGCHATILETFVCA